MNNLIINIIKKHYLLILISLLLLTGLRFNSALAGDIIRIRLSPPPPNKLGLSDLWKLELENTTRENLTIYLEGSVTESKDGLIVEGKSKPFIIKPGKTSYGYYDFKNGSIIWKNKKYQEAIVRTGNSPSGSYTICVTAKLESGEVTGQENCIEQKIEIIGEQQVTLISPVDAEEIDPDTTPGILFAWRECPMCPPMFTLRIVEIKGDQSPDFAMHNNKVFFEQREIKGITFQYPQSAPKFEAGNKYVWQITSDNIQSEIWVFSIVARKLITDTHFPEKKLLKNTYDYFEENLGQVADMEGKPVKEVLMRIQSEKGTIFFTTKGIVYVFTKIAEEKSKEKRESGDEFVGDEKEIIRWARINMELPGAEISAENLVKEDTVDSFYSNYYLPQCPDGTLHVKQYKKITFKNIYPGIDWRWKVDKDRNIKHEFIVHSSADPSVIQWKYISENETKLDKEGSLILSSAAGELQEGKPFSYEEQDQIPVISSYKVTNNIWSYNISKYNRSSTLIIDPILQWCTYYGGNGFNGITSMKVDQAGNLFITGYTNSTNFPVHAFTAAYFSGTYNGYTDAFILRFDAVGVRLWATYYGGSDQDIANAIEIDGLNNIYITGATGSTDFPIQTLSGAYIQTTNHSSPIGNNDIFILRLDANGARKWATYYGGSNDDQAKGIAFDGLNNIYVTGITTSADFPIQVLSGAYNQGTIGGSSDIFILQFDINGVCNWATYYGGISQEQGPAIAIDGLNNIYLTGKTSSADFPVQVLPGAYNQSLIGGNSDAFILRFNGSGVRNWATYYGGTGFDEGCSLAIDGLNNLYIIGSTSSIDFPVQALAGAYNQSINGGDFDAFILQFDDNGVRNWATYYGGNDWEGFYGGCFQTAIVVDNGNNLFVNFATKSQNILTIDPGAGSFYDNTYAASRDIFLAQFNSSRNLQWASYWGGPGIDFRSTIAIDRTNNYLYHCGEFDKGVSSINLPFVNPGGGAYYQTTRGGFDNSFISRFYYAGPCSCGTWNQVTLQQGSTILTLPVVNHQVMFPGVFSSTMPITLTPDFSCVPNSSTATYEWRSWNGFGPSSYQGGPINYTFNGPGLGFTIRSACGSNSCDTVAVHTYVQ